MNFTKCPFHLRTAVSCHFGWAKGANKRANVQTKRHGRGGGRSDPSVRGRLAEPRRGASPGAPRGCRGQGQNCGAAELRAHRVRFGFAVSSETHRSNALPLASASCSEPGRGAKSRGDGPRPPACRLSKTPFPQDRFAGVKSAPPPPPRVRRELQESSCTVFLPRTFLPGRTFPVRATQVRVSGPGTSQLCHLLLLGTSCCPQELICLCFQCSVTWSTGKGRGAETLVQNSGEPGE